MRRRAFAIGLAIACALVIVAMAGATRGAARGYPNLSTRQVVTTYLRSLGLNPAKMVVQHGDRNYAGPYCPGNGWNCTSATNVLQISKSQAAQNTVDCTGGGGVSGVNSQGCIVVQTGPGSNTATCNEKATGPDFAQDCDITQTGTTNSAIVNETIETLGGAANAQDSSQTAEVKQGGVSNSASVSQQIHQKQNGGTGTQSQNTHQGVTLCQAQTTDCATPNAGSNTSRIKQSVFEELYASGAVTQEQETSGGDGDCAFYGAADLCATIDQESTSSNSSDVSQDEHLLGQVTGSTNGGTVSQNQGHGDGGVAHDFVQNPDGSNSNTVQQRLMYELHGPKGSSQSQDPRASCCSSGSGNTNVNQFGKLSASEDDAFQELSLDGNVDTTGACNLTENGQVNSGKDTEQDQESGGFCSAFIDCSSATEGPGGCFGASGPSELTVAGAARPTRLRP